VEELVNQVEQLLALDAPPMLSGPRKKLAQKIVDLMVGRGLGPLPIYAMKEPPKG